ncbi:fructoselysine 6-kinase [Domibacillus sp. DTU_2020_1001157_1_SI_ALB_TIR_016]|uniref:fructoselysine 6-kinase n=1 Tax=Domibacillus sp. DTU_2020_1001157_1_SI_ALB_TIR_016 TaxID=3077789 RepID=UPI0028E8A984|nr:fructoselysine 6-kinase [Domibacillus sp. DTU_2020_1001157_1_SI_ALB_TIR_016]WNS79237.1 fructoselysine 6-kinase [Domibacillus sp. DTU_2020_1001157_1_SI_ALB_TIR_016]
MIKVLGIGDNVVDKYVHLKVMYPGGNALNFAVFAKKLGIEAAFIGTFGDDKEAEHVQSVLKELDIDFSRSRFLKGENGCARVTLQKGDRVFLDSNNGGVTGENPLILTEEDKEYIKGFNLMHTGLYSHTGHLLSELSSLGVPLSFDFSDDFEQEQIDKYISHVQYAFFSCSHLSENETREFLKRNFQISGQLLIATRGNAPAIAYDGAGFYSQAPESVEAVDTMGAGDSFITAFLLSHITGNEVSESLKSAVSYAAKSCLVEGSFGFGISYS